MPLIIPSNSISGEYEVANSLRFDDGSSDNLTHSFSTPTNDKKHTISFWTKKTIIGGNQYLLAEGSDANNTARIFFSSDGLRYVSTTSNVDDFKLVTNQVFRDVSAWYHIVITVDTTLATADDRVKMYANGQQITSFASRTNPSLNLVTRINSSGTHTISGRGYTSSDFFDGYLAEFCFIDGTALDPTSFGEFDEDTGIWKPIDVSGLTFGTNGFYLPFENSGALGQDDSGNGNNFTVNNLTSIDQTTDTCTNNFCTLNPLTVSGATLSDGNCTYTHASSASYRTCLSTFAIDSGKWYWETKIISEDGYRPAIGFASTEDNTRPYNQPAYAEHIGLGSAGVGLFMHGDIQINGSSGSPAPSTFDNNDIIGFALDLDSGTKTIKIYKNGTLDQSYNISSPLGFYTVGITGLTTGDKASFNFGNPPFSITSGNSDANGYGNFEYSVPSGYYALNSKNLAEYG